jgi:hypothetical protein
MHRESLAAKSKGPTAKGLNSRRRFNSELMLAWLLSRKDSESTNEEIVQC